MGEGERGSTEPVSFKSGYVTVAGRPNVGKSTLINALVGQKVAIVSEKPQTTRKRLLGILTCPEAQVVFVDTPGIHHPKLKLGEEMVATAERALHEADIVLCLVDVSVPPQPEDELVVQRASRFPVPRLLAANKIDLLPAQEVAEAVARYAALADFEAVFPISALTGTGLNDLLADLIDRLPSGPLYFPPDEVSDQYERDIAAEIIREAALHYLHQEVPHAVAVQVEEWKERPTGMTYIRAIIYVERESQKGILIGAGGQMLKRIGRTAREELEDFLQGRVYLDLWVKVLKNWRKDEQALRRLGLKAR